jgi:hypothetical protein
MQRYDTPEWILGSEKAGIWAQSAQNVVGRLFFMPERTKPAKALGTTLNESTTPSCAGVDLRELSHGFPVLASGRNRKLC